MTIVAQPENTWNIVGASEAVSNTDQKVLVVAQKVAAGTAIAGDLIQQLGNDESVNDGLFGVNSMVASAIRAMKRVNESNRFDVICLDDAGGGAAATGTIGFAGTATAAGTLVFDFGSEVDYTLSVSIPDTTTAAAAAGLLDTALGLVTFPVTGALSVADVDLTAVNKGTYGNSIGLRVTGTVPGLTLTLTPMTGGGTDPTLTGVFDVIGDERYQGIVWGYPDSLTELLTLLDARFNVTNNVLDGVGFAGETDTFSNLGTLGNAENSQSLVLFGDETTATTPLAGPAQFELPLNKVAYFAAIRALRLTPNQAIGQFVIDNNGALDSFGGPALASKPYFNTPISFLPLIAIGDGFDSGEIETLHGAGISVMGNNRSRTESIVGEVVTTYKTNAAGNPDISFKNLNYVDTMSNVREYMWNNFAARFAQSRLTEGDVVKGRDMANELTFITFSKRLYTHLSGADFVLLEAGDAALQFFEDNLVVSITKSTGLVTIQMTVPIVTQVRIINGTIKIAFSTAGF